MKYYVLNFAQAYGQGNYGAGTYSCSTQQTNDGTCTASASGTTGGNSGSSLTNTGIAVAAIVTLACLIIFVSLMVRIWRRKPALETVQAQDESDETKSQTD